MGDRFLRIRDLARKETKGLPMSRPTIYRMIKQGKFPRPIKMGGASVWSESEIDQWIEDRKLERLDGKSARN